MNATLDVGGIDSSIVGTYAIKAIIRHTIDAKRSEKAESCKNIAKFINPNNQMGINTVTSEFKGYLYMGILKMAYWNQSTLGFFFRLFSKSKWLGYFVLSTLTRSRLVILNSYALATLKLE